MKMISLAKEIDSLQDNPVKFSICTLVSNLEEYGEMVQSFIDAGFHPSFCEYIYIDNSQKNKFDAFSGYNQFLTKAKGQYIILCHQDILLNYDKIDKLEQCIDEMNRLHPDWGVLGNAGGINLAGNASKIANIDGTIHHEGPLPAEVKTLDENFILVKRDANIALSGNLNGFHLYGTDICIMANVLGYKVYVIDFLLMHKSYGNPGESFYAVKRDLINKYRKAFKGNFRRTTISNLYISGCSVKSWLGNTKVALKVVKFFSKAKKQLNI